MRYEPRPRGAAFAWVLVAAFSLLAVPGTYGLLEDGGAGILLAGLRLLALAYVADRLLVRTAVVAQVDGDDLVWRAPLRGGRAPLAALRRVRPARGASQWQVLELDGGRAVYVEVLLEFPAFVAELRKRRPDLDVTLGSRARRIEARGR